MATEAVIEHSRRMRPSDRYARRRRRYVFLLVGLAGGIVIGLLAGLILAGPSRPPQAAAGGGAAMTTRYQAVTLTSGQVFVGRLEKLDSAFPILSDFYTLQSKPGEGGKAVEALVQRGADEPDTLLLNADHILFVEPVRSGSRLGKLIEEAKSGPKAGPGTG
ncbi:MAG: hypothetical protein ABW020_15235 [Candidatus Rokuibacteriota bacterium]